jgi:DNA-binding GntR family transcriptional regulator
LVIGEQTDLFLCSEIRELDTVLHPEASSRPKTHRHRVRDGIQQMILSRELRSGDRLVQQNLAKTFGVSQAVVRESLIELQFSGLVHSVENLGTFVNGVGPEQLLPAWELREVLEGLAARLCCEQASRADLARFRDLADQCHRAALEGDVQRRGSLDRAFHDAIVAVSRNEFLIRVTESCRILGLAVQARRPLDDVHAEHLAIVDAIENRAKDPAQVEEIARAHVRASREALERVIQSGEFQSDWVVLNGSEDEPANGDSNIPPG